MQKLENLTCNPQNVIRPYIVPCSDLKPWQPAAESKLFLNAQPPPLIQTLGRMVPLNISYFQTKWR